MNLGILDVRNEVQKFSLLYVVLPHTNHVIKGITRGWNSHSLETEFYWRPAQLWANAMMDLRNSHIIHAGDLDLQESINIDTLEDLEWFGMD